MARDRTVYALDTIGAAGCSVQTAPLHGDADYAAWFADVLDGLGLDRVHVLGESSGAWHATLVGLYAADRVASVSLIEPNGVVTRIPWRALLRMIRFGANTTDEGWRDGRVAHARRRHDRCRAGERQGRSALPARGRMGAAAEGC
ncbi:alpha/beta fold hydrolase [Promicromonospora panici]|uniref:alpha/beta fold hydrolase n=1 Tax=Promicromonospora panici TaxID=2219658 RepID=UPI001F5C60C5|nr:alpha/beta fold hydrolase [Promicromonospora panici]